MKDIALYLALFGPPALVVAAEILYFKIKKKNPLREHPEGGGAMGPDSSTRSALNFTLRLWSRKRR